MRLCWQLALWVNPTFRAGLTGEPLLPRTERAATLQAQGKGFILTQFWEVHGEWLALSEIVGQEGCSVGENILPSGGVSPEGSSSFPSQLLVVGSAAWFRRTRKDVLPL